MIKKILAIVALLICLIVGIVTISKHNIRPTESEPTTEQIEPEPTADLDIKINDEQFEPPKAIIINEDGEILSESEAEESEKTWKESVQDSLEAEPEPSIVDNSISDETLSNEQMVEISDDIDKVTHLEAVETFRQTAKTEVARLQAEGNPEFDGITDEMIDNYSEEEINALMIKIYQNLKY